MGCNCKGKKNQEFLKKMEEKRIDNDIIDLVQESKGMQLSFNEYKHIVSKLNTPKNMLVFGVGSDTKLWIKYNKGVTVFLEHDQAWIDIVKVKTNANIIKVEYKQKSDDFMKLINNPELLLMNLPEDIKTKQWDIILVDAPVGNVNGRMESIFTASTLNYKELFVHDCDRAIEKMYTEKYLGINFNTIGKLRQWIR